MLRVLILSAITSLSFAYEAHPTYINKIGFTIDGYDLMKDDEAFPIVKEQLYDIEEVDEVLLEDNSYRKIVQVTNVDTKESHLFMTRVINDTNRAVIIDAKETNTSTYATEDIHTTGDGFYSPKMIWIQRINYDLILADGEVIKFCREEATKDTKNFTPKPIFLKGDQIEILSEEKNTYVPDFTNVRFFAKVTRDGKEIGSYTSEYGKYGPGYVLLTYTSVNGFARQDNPHTRYEQL